MANCFPYPSHQLCTVFIIETVRLLTVSLWAAASAAHVRVLNRQLRPAHFPRNHAVMQSNPLPGSYCGPNWVWIYQGSANGSSLTITLSSGQALFVNGSLVLSLDSVLVQTVNASFTVDASVALGGTL